MNKKGTIGIIGLLLITVIIAGCTSDESSEDDNGNEYVYDENEPPIAVLELDKTNVEAGEVVLADGRSSYDPDYDSITGYHWEVDGETLDSSSYWISDSRWALRTDSDDIGEYFTVSLKVQDSHGKSSTEVTKKFYVSAADDEPEDEPWYEDISIDSSSTVTVEITITSIDSSGADGTVDDIRTKLSIKNNGNEKTPAFTATLYTSFAGKSYGMIPIGTYEDIRISSGSSHSLLYLDFPVDNRNFEWDSYSSNDYLYISIGEKTDSGGGSYTVTKVNEFWVSCNVIEN